MTSESEENVKMAKKIALGMQSTDKKTRKQSLVELQQFLRNVGFSSEELHKIFVETHMYTLNGCRDKTEVVREEAIQFLSFLIIDTMPLNDFYLTYVLPVLVERIGSIEIIEESEELRLHLLEFLQRIILKYSQTEQLKPFLGDCIIILAETAKDKFPAIKELSCRCVIDLAHALPKDFHMQAENLIKPVVSCLGHQRFKVRVEAIKAIGEIIMHSSYKGLDEVVGPLAEKLFDQIPIVRKTVAEVAARWLLEYRDRYSFFHKIIPLLLTGLNDEVEETRLEIHKLWQKVGLQYLGENEKDLKDQMDFLLEPPKYYPKHLERPNLGCRVLVQRNIGKLAKALSFELQSWQEDIRFCCSQLLCSLALHAEDGITQDMQDLLPAMYSAARDQDKRVVANIIQASQIMGLFVPRKTWYQLVLPMIEAGPHHGHLTVLYGFIRGTSQEYITEHLEDIGKILSDESVCYTRKKNMQLELVKCVEAISEKYSEKSGLEVKYYLFKIIIVIISLRDVDNCSITVAFLDPLYKALKFPDSESLWSAFTPRLLTEINTDPKSWTVVTAQRCIFETVLLHSNTAFGENLKMIANILLDALDPVADVESRLKTFWALSEAFDNKSVIFKKASHLTEFFARLVSEVFVPSLVWQPGLTAESMRTMAASCLLCALTPVEGIQLFENGAVFGTLCDRLVPLLLSLLEDASYRSRQLAVECCSVLRYHASANGIWDSDLLIKIYPEILKRLDDPSEKVRHTALIVLPEIFKNCPEDFRGRHYRAHHELIIDTLFIHFDDDEENIKELVFECLKVIATINSEEVESKTRKHKPLICNKGGCNELEIYLKNLNL